MIKILTFFFIPLIIFYSCNSDNASESATTSSANPISGKVKRDLALGALDETFGPEKKGFNAFDISGSHDDGLGLLVGPSDEVYIAGYARNPEYDIVLWKLDKNGGLDTSFAGGKGYVVLDDPTGKANGNQHDFGRALAFASDGGILVTGQAHNGLNYDVIVVKYSTDGVLDQSFGEDKYPVDGKQDGFIIYSFSSTSTEDVTAIKVSSEGSIYLAGHSNSSGSDDMMIMKLTSDGQIDQSYNEVGYFLYDSNGQSEKAYALTLDASSNVIVGGIANGKPTLWKLNSTGSLDNNFSFGGVESFSSKSGDIKSVIMNSEGDILAAGHILESQSVRYDMALWKYKSSGDIDTTFGDDHDGNNIKDGYIHHHSAGGTSNGEDFAHAVILDDHDNIIICGHSESSVSHDPDMTIWRYSKNGVLDTFFGHDKNPADGNPDGFFLHHNAGGHDQTDQCRSLSLDSKGSIITSGFSVSSSEGAQMVVWKVK